MNAIMPTPTMLRTIISSFSSNQKLVRKISSNVKPSFFYNINVSRDRKTENKYDFNAEADKVVDEYYKVTKIPRSPYTSIQDYLMSQSENDYFHEQALKYAFKN